jgi:photosystem II stability/assembly factor-like uncharacterized protein
VRRLLYTAVAGVSFAAAAFALPGDVVVISDKEVRPDEAAGLYYLGQAGDGYLYNGSSAALGRVAPYRVLDLDAKAKDYYIVWAAAWVGLAPEDFEYLGTAVRLSEYEILVGLELGFGPGALRAVDHRVELIKLEPVTPVKWSYDGEEPPAKKDPRIEAAVNSITEQEYAGYIQKLQDFKTRWTDTPGCDAARDYLRGFFASQGLRSSIFAFKAIKFKKAHYPEPAGKIYVSTDHGTFKRSMDNGNTWDTIWPKGVGGSTASSYWLNANTGFVAGYNDVMAKTADGGETWETVAIEIGKPNAGFCKPFGIDFLTRDTGWLGGEVSLPGDALEGFIIRTDDGGGTWEPQPSPAGFRVGVIDFYDASHGWAPGGRYGSPGILYTDDGGDTWRECTLPASTRVRDLAATGPREAWGITRDSGRILRTTDGATWQYVDPGVPGTYVEVAFPDSSHGYAAGTKIIKTDDGGATWREITNAPQIAYDLLAFADQDHGLVGDFEAENLYRTDDGGASFVSIIENVDLLAENVIGERRGAEAPEEIVIIGGHFDSHSFKNPLFDAPGAEDNASGTACAMAAARALRDLPFKRTARYVAFGAEESGLIGSRAYAKHCAAKGEKIVAVLNADMVCYDEESGIRDDYSVGRGGYEWLFDYLKAIGNLYGGRLIYDDFGGVSDDRSFRGVGYAAMGVIEGEKGKGGIMEYPWYHTTEDTLDKLHPDLAVRFVRDYAAMFAHLAGFEDVGVEDPRPGAAAPFSRPFAVYPNPYCYATCTGGVSFVGVKSPATVEIYDLAGRRVGRKEVAAGRDECVWRPAGPGGETLAPGVYLYCLDGQEQRKAGKIVVAK